MKVYELSVSFPDVLAERGFVATFATAELATEFIHNHAHKAGLVISLGSTSPHSITFSARVEGSKIPAFEYNVHTRVVRGFSNLPPDMNN